MLSTAEITLANLDKIPDDYIIRVVDNMRVSVEEAATND